MLEYTDEEIEKITLWNILRKDQIPHCMEVFKKVCSGEVVDRVEVVFLSKSGKEIYLEGAANARFKDGKFVATRGIFRDITERKRFENALKTYARKVEEANRNKSQFVSDVSHELRTPLAAIKGFVSTMRSDKDMDPETREDFLKTADEEADRLTRIINDLLDLSRIESGRIKLNKENHKMLEAAKRIIEKKNML